MIGFFKSVFDSPDKQKARIAKRYEQEKALAQSRHVADRLKLARDPETHPEILFYLAIHDADATVRQQVALNKATPLQVSQVLAKDKDDTVRLNLAERLGRLLPHLNENQQAQLYIFAAEALGTLALDEVLKIRIALSSALKDAANAPPKVVGQLARDVERMVSEPILRYCAALQDDDLLEILKAHPASWASAAIAARDNVSEAVAIALIELDDEETGRTLIDNKSAKISRELMQSIVEKARNLPSWHRPLVLRRNLPSDLALDLAMFVDMSVRDLLLERSDFDNETISEITSVMQRRLAFLDTGDEALPLDERLKKLKDSDLLNNETLTDAIGVREQELALGMIAVMADTTMEQVRKIMAMKAPKPIVALCWKAGLAMRTALIVQRELGGVPTADILYPRDGKDYPLSEKDLRWQVDFLNL